MFICPDVEINLEWMLMQNSMLLRIILASLVTQLVKNPPAMQETWVQSLGWEDPLEKVSLPIPVFWPGEFHELYSPWCLKKSRTQLSNVF